MNLIRQIGETNVTHELFANDANIVRLGIERGARAVGHAIRGKVAVARGNERVGHLQTKRSKRRRKEVKGKKLRLSWLGRGEGRKLAQVVFVWPRWQERPI